MKLSVVIGTINRLEMLRRCIDSIFAQTSVPVRIYVTDAGSTDGTVEYLRASASERLVPILEGRRVGQARALNDVFRTIRTPYTAWLSDDNEVANRGLDVALRILEQERRIGMVALKVRDMTGPFVGVPYVGGISSLGILNVNQGLLRTPILQELGGFSEAFRDYGIDPDLTARVLLSGHDVAYTRSVAILHYRGWSTDPESAEYKIMQEKNRKYLALYERKYGAIRKETLVWRLKRRALQWIRGRKKPSDSPGAGRSARCWFGLNTRDVANILGGKYISLLDPVLCMGRSYHLLQRCPASERRRALPPDPAPDVSAPPLQSR